MWWTRKHYYCVDMARSIVKAQSRQHARRCNAEDLINLIRAENRRTHVSVFLLGGDVHGSVPSSCVASDPFSVIFLLKARCSSENEGSGLCSSMARVSPHCGAHGCRRSFVRRAVGTTSPSTRATQLLEKSALCSTLATGLSWMGWSSYASLVAYCRLRYQNPVDADAHTL